MEIESCLPLLWCGFVHHTDPSSEQRVWGDLVQGKAQQGLVEERDSLEQTGWKDQTLSGESWGHSSTPSAAKSLCLRCWG